MAHDPWAQRTASDLPPDVRELIDAFLKSPKVKSDIIRVGEIIQRFRTRAAEASVIIALAEIDDGDIRVSLAKTLYGMAKAGVGRPPVLR